MSERLKVLDCNRKAVLILPANAFKLWMTYWMNEDEENESYVSQGELKTQTGMSIPTIITWTKYLVRQGWLVATGKSAYDKLLMLGKIPTDNSKQVTVFRVDDPTTKTSLGVPLKDFEGYTPKKLLDKVSCSGSGSGFDSSSDSSSTSHSDSDSAAAPRWGKEEVKNEDQNQKPENPKTNTRTKTRLRLAGDGTPWPEDFDSWSNLRRITWRQEHDGSDDSRKEKETWDKQLAIARRSEFLGPEAAITAAAAMPPAPIKQQEQKQGNGEFKTRDGRLIQAFPDDE